MALLIPQAVKRLKEAGREAGVERGKKKERARIREILAKMDDGLPPEEAIEELKNKLLGSDSGKQDR